MVTSIGVICLVCTLSIFACGGERPSHLGISAVGLAPCPSSSNCVSSDASDADHRVEAFALAAPANDAWRIIREEVANLPRTTVVDETADYLHAECASSLFGFVDDLELHLRASGKVVAIRSASRVGYSDLGANRRRVERLRESLRERGIVQ